MKKPSKLLSLFLAFVMLLTSLSVGLTALAKEWSGSAAVNGANVTDQIDAIAHALWGADGDNGNFSSIADWDGGDYVNTGVKGDANDTNGDWYGNHLYDNADGDMYTAVKNAWDVVFNVQDIVGKTSGTNNQINNTIGTVLKNAIQNYMGGDFQAQWGNTGNNTILYGWFGLGAGFHGTNASGGNNKSYNVYISLVPEYYAWKYFADNDEYLDDDGNVDIDKIPNKVISERTFYWHSPDPGGTSPANQYNYADTALLDQESDAVLVNMDEIKAFNALFVDGDDNYWEDFVNGEFDNIPDVVQTAILNGAVSTYKDIQTKEYSEWHEAKRGGGDFNHDVYTSHEATQVIFDNYFCTEEEFFGEGFTDADFSNDAIGEESYYYAFLKYIVQKFIDAVNAIEVTYYADGTINDGLSLEELIALRSDIDAAYNIWNALPSSLYSMAETEKDKLDVFYYNETDTAADITSFVPAWNTANAQAYIDAVEDLEFASGYVSGVEGDEYIIKNKIEADKVKALLDTADALYGNLIWEASYEETAEKDGAPGFDEITILGEVLEYVSPQNGYTIKAGITVFDYANKVYRGAFLAYYEYLYRQFMEIASKNLDEYVEDSNGNGAIDLTDQIVIPAITLLDVVPVQSQINKVKAAYNPLVQEFRDRDWVVFYMNIVEALEAALNGGSIEKGSWERYDDLKYPYLYNWDEKDQSTQVTDEAQAILDSLDALLGSPQIAQLLGADSLADFASGTIESLIADNANTIIQAILTMVMPMIQDAMADASVDNDTVLVIHTDILSAKRNGGQLTSQKDQLTMTVMFPDPMDLVSRIEHYTSNPNTIAAANKIAEAVYEWDDVDWEAVDWKLDLADDPVDEFCNIVGGILECIAKLVNSLLFNIQAVADLGGSCANLAGGMADTTITQYYNAGYEKDILPFLELLGCEGLESTATLTSWARDNNKWAAVVKAMVNPLLNRVQDLLTGDVASNILGILPNLSYLLLWDMIAGTSPNIDQSVEGGDGWTRKSGDTGNKDKFEANPGYAGVKDLLAPLSKFAGLTLEGFGIESLDGSFIMDTINGMLADTGIVLPDINWAMIAGMGNKVSASSLRSGGTRETITANQDEILMFFLNYIAEVIYTNKDAIYAILNDALGDADKEIVDLVDQLFDHFMANAEDAQAFGAIILEFFRGVEVSDYEWTDPANWEWSQSLVDYTGLKYDEAYVNGSIDKLATIAINALNQLVYGSEDTTLTEFLATAEIIDGKPILTGDIINTLFSAIYSLDSDLMRTVLGLVETTDKDGNTTNIDLSPATTAATLAAAGYGDIAALLENLDYYVETETKEDEETGEETTEVIFSVFDSITADMWNVTDVDSFKTALITILAPFSDLLGNILAGQGGSTTIAKILTVVGDNGYTNVVKPLLAIFGAGLLDGTSLMEEDAFNAAPADALKNVIDMVFDLIDAYGADPVNSIISVIPQLASFIDNNGIQNLVSYIIQPLWNIISAVLDLFMIDNEFVPDTGSNRIYGSTVFDVLSDILFDDDPEMRGTLTWDTLHENLFGFINVFLEDIITIGDETYSIVLPDINLADLGGSGTKLEQGIDPDKASVVVKVLRYIWRVVVENSDTIEAVLTDKVGEFWGKLSKYITISDYTEDDFVYLVLTVINGLDSSDYDSTDIWDEILNAVYKPATDVKYPVDPNGKAYTPKDVDELVQFLSGLALGVVEEFVDGFDISDIGPTIYSSAVPGIIGKSVLPLLESAGGAFKALGIDYGYEDLIAGLTDAGYKDVVKAITAQKVDSLAAIDWSAIADGNLFAITTSEQFTKALVTLLEPFMPLVEFLLNSGMLLVLDVVPLVGSNGYANAVLPLLQTLGIDAVDAKTYAADAEADPKNLLADIINPLFAWVDNALWIADGADGPVGTLLSRLPEIAKFLDQGGLQQFIGDITYPFSNLINTILEILTNGKQDNIFNLALVIGTEMAKESTGGTDDIFDKILEIIFGESTPAITWDTLHEHVFDLAAMLINIIDIGATAEVDKKGNLLLHISVSGTPMTIKIPKYDLAKLAGIDGSDKVKKTTDSLLVVLQYFWDGILNDKTTFKSVKALLVDILGNNYFTNVADKTLGTYIENLLTAKINDIVSALIQTKDGLDSSAHKADWSFLFKNYKASGYSYPKGVTGEDIQEVIDILTTAIENALMLFFDTSLPSLAADVVYTNDIAEAVKGIVNSLAENKTITTVFSLLGLDLKVNNKTYNVTDKASFAAALADILAPFEPLTDVLLNSGELNIVDLVTITGADGFNNAVKPFLQYALGCTNVKDGSFKGIITAVLDRVEELLADPINELLDALPTLANFIDKGGVQYFVEELIYPIVNLTSPLVTLITKESLFDFAISLLGFDMSWDNAQNDIFSVANSMLKNITINGKSYSITIPSIKWSNLAGCGKLSGKTITAVRSDVIMSVFSYLFKVLNANSGVLYDLVGGKNTTIGQIITNILKLGANGFVKIVVTVLLKMETYDNVSWLFKKIKPVETTYTPNYGEEDYTRFVEDIDAAIFGLLGSFAPDLNVATLLSNNVYKNSIVNSVAKLVYTNLEKISVAGISIHKLLKAIDLDITNATVADMLKDFAVASAEIGKHDAWADVDFDSITWNFEDGDKAGFVSALSAALRPIQPLIRVILSGEDLIVLGSITVKGGNGYNTTVIPLLEALGVEPATLVSPADYSAEADTDKVLTSVLTPLLDFAETLLDKPIYTLANMLPNVAYFLLNGGAKAIVENIGGPIFNILNEVAPIYDLNLDKLLKDNIGFGISDLGNPDLDGIVNTLLASIKINGAPLPIRITDIDLETLAGRGELVEYTSARTYNGVPMECKKIIADTPAVFISVLRYIVDNLKANLDAIKELLAGLGLSGDIADMINMILGFLTDLDTDMVIEQLMELLFGAPSEDEAAIDPYEVRDMSIPYWSLVAGATAFTGLIFLALLTEHPFALFAKKKKEGDPGEGAEA